MKNGDISNEVVPRLALVFEGLVGVLSSPREQAVEALARKAKRWKRAVSAYSLNDPMVRRIWDTTWRLGFNIDVVTFLGEGFCSALRERLEDEDQLPISKVWASTPQRLSREIAYMPELAAIYDPDPSHRFTYGGKGRIIDPTHPELLGAF